MQDSVIIDNITENLLHVLPVVHKKLLRIDLESLGMNLSRLHLVVMTVLYNNRLPISEIARRLLIPKPQMTHLIDRLVTLGIAERQPDSIDRRVVYICLTDAGQHTLAQCRHLVRENIRMKLSSLSAEELNELATSLEKIRKIGAKFES